MKIVYNAFNGRYADNPRALHEALVPELRQRGVAAEHLWLADESMARTFPSGVATVAVGSPHASAALSACDLLITNTHIQLDRWTKATDSYYLQTWHGTPLKRIHRSAVSLPAESVLAELDADIARWDALVSQGPDATELLRSAFDYHGAVLAAGYPRNDLLLASDTDRRRHELRTRLGIDDETIAVLYAPTYRDDEVDREGPGLDVVEFSARLGPGYVVLLRRHYYLSAHRERSGVPGLIDVSAHAEVAELYLAADVLITDYSSAMFDFAVTGKPLLLHPFDLPRYRDTLRGFTFDLETEGPGPVLIDAGDLVDAVRDLPGTVAASGAKYAAFRARWCAAEDGHATERVLAAVLKDPGLTATKLGG